MDIIQNFIWMLLGSYLMLVVCFAVILGIDPRASGVTNVLPLSYITSCGTDGFLLPCQEKRLSIRLLDRGHILLCAVIVNYIFFSFLLSFLFF